MADLRLALTIAGKDEGAIGLIKGLGGALTQLGGAPLSAASGLVDRLGKLGLAGLGIQTALSAVKGAVGILNEPLQAASDLSESMNKVDVVFGDSAGSVKAFAATAAQALGQSQQTALSAAGTFGNLFVSMGLGQDHAAAMSTDIVKLASDLASFNNIKPEEALEKLRAGLVGETEPLRSLGVNLSAAAVEAKAMEMGLAASTKELTAADKAQASYALILEQTKTAQGDFARTSSGMANAQRIISASFEDIKVKIGEQLLPVVAPLISQFAQALPGAMAAATPVIERVGQFLQGLAGHIPALLQAASGLVPLFQSIGPAIGSAIDSLLAGFSQLIGAGDPFEWSSGTLETLRTLFDYLMQQAQPVLAGLGATFQTLAGIVGQALSGDIAGALQSFLQLILAGREQLAQAVAGWGQAFVGWLQDAWPALKGQLGELLVNVITVIREGVFAYTEQLAGWAAAFIDWVGPMLPDLLRELGGILVAIVGWMADEGFPAIVERLGQWADAFVAWVEPRIGPMLEELGKLLLHFSEWAISTALPTIAQKLAEWGLAFVTWVGPRIVPLLGELAKLLLKIGEWFQTDLLPTVNSEILKLSERFVDWVANDVLPHLPGKLKEIYDALVSWLTQDVLPEVGRQLGDLARAFLDWVVDDVLPSLPATLQKISDGLFDWIQTTADSIGPKVLQWGVNIVNGIVAGLAGLGGALANAISEAIASIFPIRVGPITIGRSGVSIDLPNIGLPGGSAQSLGGFQPAGVPGFATGGSFTVGGGGGTDSQLVMFRATPGERVDVRTPGQQGERLDYTRLARALASQPVIVRLEADGDTLAEIVARRTPAPAGIGALSRSRLMSGQL